MSNFNRKRTIVEVLANGYVFFARPDGSYRITNPFYRIDEAIYAGQKFELYEDAELGEEAPAILYNKSLGYTVCDTYDDIHTTLRDYYEIM